MKKDLNNETLDFGEIKDDHWYEFSVRENKDTNSRRTGRYNIGINEYPSGAYPWSIIHLEEFGSEEEAKKLAQEYANDEMQRRKTLGLNLKNPHIKKSN